MSLVEEFLECGPEDLLLPDADCILFMNVPGRDRTQQWHRDMRWAGEGGDYSEEGQRVRWQEIQEAAKTSPCGHNGYFEDHGGSYFRWALSLIDNIGTGLEIVPKSHRRFRTEFENDCLLPEGAKLEGHGSRLGGTPKAMSDGEGGESLIPGATFVDLKAGQAVLWSGDMLHRGRTPVNTERLTLSCSWSRWNGLNAPLPDCELPTLPSLCHGQLRAELELTRACALVAAQTATARWCGSSTRRFGRRCRPSG